MKEDRLLIGKQAYCAVVILCALGAPVDAPAGETASADMSAAVLKLALRGEDISYRGRSLEGDIAAAFGEGYVFSIAERAEAEGVWCGLSNLPPHEMIARVFDALPAADDPEGSSPAAVRVPEILAAIYSCNSDGQPR